jgi:hypothetical protein
MLAEEKEPAARLSLVAALARNADDPHAFEVLLTAAEYERETITTLLRVAEKKSLPKILAILAKNDEAIRLTLAELPLPAATLTATLEAIAPLLEREDLAVNRHAFQTLVQLSALRSPSEWLTWIDKAQSSLVKRMPHLKKNLESGDVEVRTETVKLLRQVAGLHEAINPSWRRVISSDIFLYSILPDESSVNELLALARRDNELTVRRIARKPIATYTGLFGLE